MNFIRIGFRAVRDSPALVIAEIAWRWTFGVAAWIAFALTLRTIMAGVDVSPVERSIAQTSDAFRIADSLARILVQVLPRFIHALAIVVPVLALVWIAAATLGRAATLQTLVGSGRSAGLNPADPAASGRLLASLTLLSALRALFGIAAVIAFFGTVFIVSANTSLDAQSGVAPVLVFAWMLLGLFLSVLWGAVNWFLSLAAIFCARDGAGPFRAIASSLALYRKRSRDYMATASGFGLFRLAALVVATLAGIVVVAIASVPVALVLSFVLALAYFAAADFLYIARVASYVALAAAPAEAASVAVIAGPIQSPPPASDLKLET